MRAVTFQAPGEVLVEDVPEPELQHPQDALVRVEASGICGSDLHIYHGRVPVEPGFTIGHEYRRHGARGRRRRRARRGGRPRARLLSHRVRHLRGLRARRLSPLPAAAARSATEPRSATCPARRPSRLLVPRANLTLRRVPEGMSADVALFAGDVMGTGYHAICARRYARRATRSPCSGLGPVGLCAVQAARAIGRGAGVRDRHGRRRASSSPRTFGATAVHLTEEEPKRVVRAATEGLGVDVVVDAVGDPGPLRAGDQPCPRRRHDLRGRRLRGARRGARSAWPG